ncbi:MAG: pyridoxal phosphate-dependent aminotransferase [Steroidobacteraceae bacterium]
MASTPEPRTLSLASPTHGPRSFSGWTRSAIAELAASQGRILSLFESSVPEPTHLLTETAALAFGRGFTDHYAGTFVSGNPFVVSQLCQRYGVDASSVLCTTGASSALSLIYRACLKPGDRVLIEKPGFDLFEILATLLGIGVDRFERSAPAFTLDPAKLAQALHPRTRLIVCTDLHNPSGSLATPEALREIGALARRQEALVAVDEVYADYAGPARRAAATLGDNFFSISSLTKNYGLSTLRCGWVIANPRILAAVRHVYDETDFGVSKLAHSVAAFVLEQRDAYDRHWQDMLRESRPVMQRQHESWAAAGLVSGQVPAHGCIYFPRLTGVDNTGRFTARAAREHGVYLAPGEYFDAPGHVRIGFGQPVEKLREALARLTAALQAHRRGSG